MEIQEIKQKYLGDDGVSKAMNKFNHQMVGKLRKNGNMADPKMTDVVRGLTGLHTANSYAEQNKFKFASIFYKPNEGWVVQANRMGSLTPV